MVNRGHQRGQPLVAKATRLRRIDVGDHEQIGERAEQAAVPLAGGHR